MFSVIVPEDGIYPFRILYWQGGGGINGELWTLEENSGTAVLINDLAAAYADGTPAVNRIPAYRSYTGPARPWTRFSVSPTPWDLAKFQNGPGPIELIGRTVGSATASDIYNLLIARPWADTPIGGTIANGASDPTVALLLNGAPVPATKTTNGADVTLTYISNPPLASGSTNTASLVYAGSTNSWPFTVQSYATLDAGDAEPIASSDSSAVGFSVKVVQAASGQANTAARAEAQLAGTPASVAIPNPGSPDGRYIVPGFINWNVVVNGFTGAQAGNFQNNVYGANWPFPDYDDAAVPGIPGTGLSGNARFENITAEIFAYLEFPAAGYYRLGGNADDGIVVKVGTPGVTNGTVIFTQNRGAGAQDIPFSFVVPEAGLYPIRFLWYQGGGGGNVEFFSYDENNNKIPVNDRSNPKAIKAYYRVSAGPTGPRITSANVASGQITIEWTGGGTLESSPTVDGPTWTSTGDSDGSFSEPTTGSARFYRVRQ